MPLVFFAKKTSSRGCTFFFSLITMNSSANFRLVKETQLISVVTITFDGRDLS